MDTSTKTIMRAWFQIVGACLTLSLLLMALSGCGSAEADQPLVKPTFSSHNEALQGLLKQYEDEKIISDEKELEQFFPGAWTFQTFGLDQSVVGEPYAITFGPSEIDRREIDIYYAPPFLNYQPAVTVAPQLSDYPECQQIFSDLPVGVNYLSDGREPLVDGYAWPQKLVWDVKAEDHKFYFQSFEVGMEYPTCCETAQHSCKEVDLWRGRISSRARNYELLGVGENAFLITDGSNYFVFLKN